MLPGALLAGRFEIQRLAGAGSMGTVYRALDHVAGREVAVKVLTNRDGDDERFAREARVLSELSHPAIVRYVAHGSTPQGAPFLAMEWLEGEDLAERLGRAGLSVAESFMVVRRVAEGLAAAHAIGIVHRDVKPSNVFLLGGEPARAKLLDFGIVRLEARAHGATAGRVTGTGLVLGTLGYMSPEQATADRAVDARSDVFALGSVFFECLTGEPAFSGAHVVAVLAKVLREDAPRVRQLRPELPPVLDDLVARMLSKDKAGRPADGGEVLRELESFGSIVGGVPTGEPRSFRGLSGVERRLISVMLAVIRNEPQRVSEIVRRHGGEQAVLANGALLVTVSGRGSSSDQVVSAAVCALELREAFPSAQIALATGRAATTEGGPPGPVIDQAAALLARSQLPGVRIDEVTAGLLGERFEVRQDGDSRILRSRRSDGESPRTLLGRPTPCVGRNKELTLLDGTLNECIDESVARAVLVTGPPGQGKSRLQHEFVTKARTLENVTILKARADPMGAGSAFMMVRQLVRQAIGLRNRDDSAEPHATLRAYVADICKGGDFARTADFLGELLCVPSVEQPSPQLRAARNDPQIMAVWLERSFGEWLSAECAARPLLLVLEDLHWGDLPSMMYLGEGLRALKNEPLMVLALARPEVNETFPNLWKGSERHDIALGRLPPRAAERLVRAALGETAGGEAVTRIVERADGNAFYLEELIRRVAEGGDESLPETVLSLMQSRLERLEPEARRIVRAASIFGEVFWADGVKSLVGSTDGGVDAWLETLAEREVLTTAHDGRFLGERECAFRHGLLREAAYAMLTDRDRTTGHRLAGAWLERAGEKDALSLADHFERGGDPKRALPWIVRAAQAAFEGGNTEATIALGHRGIAAYPEDHQRGQLRQAQAMALFTRGDLPACVEVSREAMGLFALGSTPWFLNAAIAFSAGMFLGDPGVTGPVHQAIVGVPFQPQPSGPYGIALVATCIASGLIGQLGFARSFLARAEDAAEGTSAPDLVFVLHCRVSRGFLELADGNLGEALARLAEARTLADQTGDDLGRAVACLYTVIALAQAGHCERAAAAFQELLSVCRPRGFNLYTDWGTVYLTLARLQARRVPEADAIDALTALLSRADRHVATSARALIARAWAQAGDFARATQEATVSVEEGSSFPRTWSAAFGTLSLIELRRGRASEALEFSERGLDAELRMPSASSGSSLYLARAEAFYSLGRLHEARVAIGEARDRVLRIAGTLDGEPELRESYLTEIDANARTLLLASEWLGAQ
jgi:tetratricopeptide (TPR) repeat protein